ncbi:hypothetical protein [Lacipirellula parvula]|uniref:Uncharacterized protein n=1 Tax=Lacipirellula parvula TaxID=2650471 RepID=A0A5K7X8Y5_9BACT|nr:hypothetical protein [Lacipirellula parvula]BBO32362.1 hypothetical protein PLANPX_1974 [Lacipirellula parvula]
MSLSSQLLAELRNAIGQGSQSFSITAGTRTIHCRAIQCEPFAATIDELTLETAELAGASVAQLQTASQSLAQRVNYLLEPIAPIETDSQGCSVQMRSNPPQRDDNASRYYELLLRRGGSIALCRFEKQPGQPRLRVPAALTHEVIGRLVDDFSSTVDSI